MSPLSSAADSLSFNWDTQQTQILEGLKNLAFEKEDDILLTDVTLACDGEYVQAHKLVLSLCSAFFKDLFQKNRADKSNTIVILGNVSARSLRHLLQFMYHGRVDIPKEHVDAFLQAGKLLKVEGLIENVNGQREEEIAGSGTPIPVENQSQSSSSRSSTHSLSNATSSKRLAGSGSMTTPNNNDKITIHVYKKRRINEQGTTGGGTPVKMSAQETSSVIQNQPSVSVPVDPLLDLDLDGTGELESDTEETPVFKSEMMEDGGDDDDSHEESEEDEPNSATPVASNSGPASAPGPSTSSKVGGQRSRVSLSENQRRKLRVDSARTKKDISKIYCMINSMHAMLCQMNGGQAAITLDLPVNLPLSSSDEFDTLNTWLKESNNRATLVAKLGSIASGDVSIVTIGIMRRLVRSGSGLDEHLTYSRVSNNDNNVFLKQTNVHFAILDSVRTSCGTNITEKDINKHVKNYCNGRKQRVYGKKPRQIEVSEDEET